MCKVCDLLLRLNLDATLPLWLEAISNGEYDQAKRIMDWRQVMRQRLGKHHDTIILQPYREQAHGPEDR